MSIWHISDLHIGKVTDRYTEYKFIFNEFAKHLHKAFEATSVKPIVVITGDVFDRKDTVTGKDIEIFTFLMELLKDHKVVMIPGNHDTNLNNPNSMDLISPLLALGDDKYPNLKYSKHTEAFTIVNDINPGKSYSVNFVHISIIDVFDRINTMTLLKQTDKPVLLYHGAVEGSNLMGISSSIIDITYDIMDMCHIGLLGDIHESHSMQSRSRAHIAYAGSMIQQNRGESINKGFLVWDHDGRMSTLVVIPNPYSAKFKIFGGDTIRADIVKYKEENKNALDVCKNIMVTNMTSALGTDLEKENEIIRAELGPNVKIITVPITKTKLHACAREYFEKFVDDQAYADPSKTAEIKAMYKRTFIEPEFHNWTILSVRWDNILIYGPDNYINFTEMRGLSGVIAGNQMGKSTIIDVIVFGLFGDQLRGKVADIVKTGEIKCSVEVEFSVDNTKYSILRSRNGGNQKNVFKQINPNGEYIIKSGTDVGITNKEITKLIGKQDDFLSTALYYENRNDVIRMKPNKRISELRRLFDIGNFDDVAENLRLAISDNVKIISKHQKPTVEDPIQQYEIVDKRIIELNIELKGIDSIISTAEKQQKDLQSIAYDITKYSKNMTDLKECQCDLDKRRSEIDAIESLITEHTMIPFPQCVFNDYDKYKTIMLKQRENIDTLNHRLKELQAIPIVTKPESDLASIQQKIGGMSDIGQLDNDKEHQLKIELRSLKEFLGTEDLTETREQIIEKLSNCDRDPITENEFLQKLDAQHQLLMKLLPIDKPKMELNDITEKLSEFDHNVEPNTAERDKLDIELKTMKKLPEISKPEKTREQIKNSIIVQQNNISKLNTERDELLGSIKAKEPITEPKSDCNKAKQDLALLGDIKPYNLEYKLIANIDNIDELLIVNKPSGDYDEIKQQYIKIDRPITHEEYHRECFRLRSSLPDQLHVDMPKLTINEIMSVVEKSKADIIGLNDIIKNLGPLPDAAEINEKLNKIVHREYKYNISNIDNEIKTLESRSNYSFGSDCNHCKKNIQFIDKSLFDARKLYTDAVLDKKLIDEENMKDTIEINKLKAILASIVEYNATMLKIKEHNDLISSMEAMIQLHDEYKKYLINKEKESNINEKLVSLEERYKIRSNFDQLESMLKEHTKYNDYIKTKTMREELKKYKQSEDLKKIISEWNDFHAYEEIVKKNDNINKEISRVDNEISEIVDNIKQLNNDLTIHDKYDEYIENKLAVNEINERVNKLNNDIIKFDEFTSLQLMKKNHEKYVQSLEINRTIEMLKLANESRRTKERLDKILKMHDVIKELNSIVEHNNRVRLYNELQRIVDTWAKYYEYEEVSKKIRNIQNTIMQTMQDNEIIKRHDDSDRYADYCNTMRSFELQKIESGLLEKKRILSQTLIPKLSSEQVVVEQNKTELILQENQDKKHKLRSEIRDAIVEQENLRKQIVIKKSYDEKCKPLEVTNDLNISFRNCLLDKGLKLRIISKHITEIEVQMNKCLELITDFTIKFDIDVETNHIDINIINKNGTRYNIETISGFQTFAISIVFRIVLTKMRPISTDFIFIDEGFGVIDNDRIKDMVEFLGEIVSNYRFAFIISHVKELQQALVNPLTIGQTPLGNRINTSNTTHTNNTTTTSADTSPTKESENPQPTENTDATTEKPDSKYTCPGCGAVLKDNKSSRKQHESTPKHKKGVEVRGKLTEQLKGSPK